MLHVLLAGSFAYALLCLALLVVNLVLLPRLSREAPAEGGRPFLSIIVPARNEEREIERALRLLLAQDYPELEIIVVDDCSTDRTPEVLSRMSGEPRLSIVRGVAPPAGWLGKPHALAQGARAARGELLLFVDADVRYRSDVCSRAVGFLLRRNVDFLALLPRFEVGGFWEAVLMPHLLCAVFFGPAFLANRDWVPWLAAGGGAGNLVRRRVYDAVGGHAALADSVIDDVHLAVLAKRGGFRTRMMLAHELVSVRMYRGFREVWDGFTKNVAYALGGATGAVFLLLALLWTLVSILPPAALAAGLAGAPLPPRELRLAAAATATLIAARFVLAAALRDPLWPAVTQPLMSAVWSALLVRSVYERWIRRRLVWRGRRFDARGAKF